MYALLYILVEIIHLITLHTYKWLSLFAKQSIIRIPFPVAITLIHPQNLLMGTISMMDIEVLFPTSFDAVTLNSNKLQPFFSGSRNESVLVTLKASETFDVRFVICKW